MHSNNSRSDDLLTQRNETVAQYQNSLHGNLPPQQQNSTTAVISGNQMLTEVDLNQTPLTNPNDGNNNAFFSAVQSNAAQRHLQHAVTTMESTAPSHQHTAAAASVGGSTDTAANTSRYTLDELIHALVTLSNQQNQIQQQQMLFDRQMYLLLQEQHHTQQLMYKLLQDQSLYLRFIAGNSSSPLSQQQQQQPTPVVTDPMRRTSVDSESQSAVHEAALTSDTAVSLPSISSVVSPIKNSNNNNNNSSSGSSAVAATKRKQNSLFMDKWNANTNTSQSLSKEELEALLQYNIKEAAAKVGLTVPKLKAIAKEKLGLQRWPGAKKQKQNSAISSAEQTAVNSSGAAVISTQQQPKQQPHDRPLSPSPPVIEQPDQQQQQQQQPVDNYNASNSSNNSSNAETMPQKTNSSSSTQNSTATKTLDTSQQQQQQQPQSQPPPQPPQSYKSVEFIVEEPTAMTNGTYNSNNSNLMSQYQFESYFPRNNNTAGAASAAQQTSSVPFKFIEYNDGKRKRNSFTQQQQQQQTSPSSSNTSSTATISEMTPIGSTTPKSSKKQNKAAFINFSSSGSGPNGIVDMSGGSSSLKFHPYVPKQQHQSDSSSVHQQSQQQQQQQPQQSNEQNNMIFKWNF